MLYCPFSEATPNSSDAAAKLARQVARKLPDQCLSISRSPLARLLGFDNVSPNFPIGGSHQGIDATYRGGMSCHEQLNNSRSDFAVIFRNLGALFIPIPLFSSMA